MINTVKLDERMADIVNENKEEIDAMVVAIGKTLKGHTYGAGFISLQVSMIILLNNFGPKQRLMGIETLVEFLQMNIEPLVTDDMANVAPSTDTMQ